MQRFSVINKRLEKCEAKNIQGIGKNVYADNILLHE
uniref:Transposase n=1 Tax=Heterorhabditis bacteriophora TaxID=37862 RepID=A0A1I7W6A8_HETBA